MHSLMSLDIAQMTALRGKIAEIEALPPAEQARKQCLLNALRCEEKSLRQYNRRSPGKVVVQAA